MSRDEGCSTSTGGERVLLNVGGKIFETTLFTLNKIGNSVLATMVSDRWKRGVEIFIDRDPTHFGKILNYLRDGDEFTVPQDVDACEELKREAQFYNLPGLVELCGVQPLREGDEVQWRKDAIAFYWRPFIRYMVDDSLSLPFIYDRNNHTLAKCIACEEFQDPKCSYLFDLNYTDWEAMRHHMVAMKGEITQLMGGQCCNVTWDNGQTIHLPKSALRRASNSPSE
ncbi:hypothetical protein WR25_13636 [Diploscapter pachys]|uniref:BTB domain-containing protein n=1 Tax=Diploscapter pachys TaxID=2018661 RepID=A0A2A2KPG8_9BILA|nr:hypothetical protein WR25_13636 [Diploscapter pachys]